MHRFRLRSAFALGLSLAVLFAYHGPTARAAATAASPQDLGELADPEEALVAEQVTADLEQLGALGDRTPSHVFRRLANSHDPRVPDGLADVFADTSLLWCTRSLALTAWARNLSATEAFEEADDAEEARGGAVEAFLAAARTWLDDETSAMRRAAAIEALAELGDDGAELLKEVVDVRNDTLDALRAFEVYAAAREFPDYSWFNEVYQRGGRKAPEQEQEDYAVGGALVHLREIAFDELAADMQGEKVEDALESESVSIRVRANQVQEEREDKKFDERAEEYFEDDDEPIELRIWGASAISRMFDRQRHFTDLFDYGLKSKCDPELRLAISDLINDSMPQKVLDGVRKQLERGKPQLKLFAIDSLPERVMAGLGDRVRGGPARGEEGRGEDVDAYGDEKVLEALRRNLFDRDESVVWRSIQALVDRNDVGALLELERALRRTKDPVMHGVFLRARCDLNDDESVLVEDALELVDSESFVARRAAVHTLSHIDPDGHEGFLREQLFDGPPTMKRAVIEGIEAREWGRGITMLIEALDMDHPTTRRLARRTLWSMTARDEGARAEDWQEWWATQRGVFEPVERELAAEMIAQWGRPLRRENTLSELLGLPLTRGNVAIALDLDGEALNPPASRRSLGEDLAPSYLTLVRNALVDFARHTGPVVNCRVLSLAEGVDPPWEGSAALGPESASRLDEWLSTYVPIRTATHAQILHEAELDLDVETLVVLTTGDPKRPDLEEAETLRRAFSLRNTERDLVVHVIALGNDSRTLKWLATTSGGEYLFVP